MEMPTAQAILRDLWIGAKLPIELLAAHQIRLLNQDQHVLPSSYRIGCMAQACIAATAVAASLYRHLSTGAEMDEITVDARHAALEFASEKMIRMSTPTSSLQEAVHVSQAAFKETLGLPPDMPANWDPLAGYYECKDGRYIRLHTNWAHHKVGLLRLLDLPSSATRAAVAGALLQWDAEQFETAAREAGMCATMSRTLKEWEDSEMGRSVHTWLTDNGGCPIKVSRVVKHNSSSSSSSYKGAPDSSERLSQAHLRVLDLSRVIAAPIAGRVLAAHGADVLLVSCMRLPNLPLLELDTTRGKRATDLDLDGKQGQKRLRRLVEGADVMLQAYRPGSLARRGISMDVMQSLRPGLIYAELDAYGFSGPWKDVRGFDSLVQSASGINACEAESYDEYMTLSGRNNVLPETKQPKPLPCQALDHASGYLLAFGILAAKCRSFLEGKEDSSEGWHVQISLAATAAWLQSLGRVHGREAWEEAPNLDVNSAEVLSLLEPYRLEGPHSTLSIYAMRHSASNVVRRCGTIPTHRGADPAQWTT